MSLLSKIIAVLLLVATTMFGVYKWGYSVAEGKAKLEQEKLNTKISLLEAKEENIKKEVVTKYVDRIKVVKTVEQQILEVTDNALQKETAACTIGDNFIWLHNTAASNQAVSESSFGTTTTAEAASTATTK